MTLKMSQLVPPMFDQGLTALSAVLDKGEAFAKAKNIDEAVLLNTRLAPDMFALARQVQIACDFAKLTAARLAEVEAPKFEDDETTFAQLKARIAKTLAFVHSVGAAQIDASAERDITFPAGPGLKATLKGDAYLLHRVMPNFFFHATAAYSILRHCGVELGKRDYIGAVPGFAPVAA